MRKSFFALTVAALILGASAVAYAAAPTPDVYGQITQIDCAAKFIVVGTTTVFMTDETVITICQVLATCEELVVGQTVKVYGSEVDGNFVAKKICVPCLKSLDVTPYEG